jgi:hypothetical protein
MFTAFGVGLFFTVLGYKDFFIGGTYFAFL